MSEIIINSVKKWLESCVIELNLCPFAKREYINNRIHFQLSKAKNEQALLEDLKSELIRLNDNRDIETTLLIHPDVLTDFYDYNEFLDIVDGLLIDMDLDGIYQVASFHPNYQFAGTQADDAENYTNRSPYPLLHILREDSLEQAVSHYPDPELIPERNIALVNELGIEKMQAMFNNYFLANKKS